MGREHIPISYGDEFAKCFYLNKAPSILMNPTSRFPLAMTRLTLHKGLPNPSGKVIPEKGFTVSVHLIRPVSRGWGTWVDGKFQKVMSWVEGGVGIYDLEADPIALRPSSFDSVHYNLPRATLDAFTEENGLPKVGSLVCTQGAPNPVLFHLTSSLVPCFNQPDQHCQLFLDHFVQMFCSHIVRAYSGIVAKPRIYQGGLAPWRERRVVELLNENLDGQLSLSDLSDECGLSVSHFARSFKITFGASVHQYLILRRIERAKIFLTETTKELSTIAFETGFSDQAAFSRTFASAAGLPPGKWRNEHARKRVRSGPGVSVRRRGPNRIGLL